MTVRQSVRELPPPPCTIACAIAIGSSNETSATARGMDIAFCYHRPTPRRQRNFARMREGRATTIGRCDRAPTSHGWHGPRTVRLRGGTAMHLRYALMALLGEGEAHGYALRKRFTERVGPFWHPNIGQVYQVLHELE